MARITQADIANRVRHHNNTAKIIADAAVNGWTITPAMVDNYQAAGQAVDDAVAQMAAQRRA